jgi:ABC-type transport system involved in multi-copper enzyme maturation permease subunit
MRLWAEERRNGSIELLLTQPITLWQAVLGKFLAAWAFVGIALALTFPIWLTVNYLGDPDNGAILAAYLGSLFIAGGFLAVGSFTSSITRNQLIAFLIAGAVVLPAADGRLSRGHRLLPALGATMAGRRRRLTLVPRAFRKHHQGCARPA